MKIFIAALLFAIAISQATADAAASANDKYFWPPPPPNYYELL